MSKLPDVGTTIFTTMSKLAAEHSAINLAQGFPDFEIDPKLEDCLKQSISKPIHQYFPMSGHPNLLREIRRLVRDRYGRILDQDQEILVTAGATEGIFSSIMALVKQAEEVIILDPSYDCYSPTVTLAGGVPVHVALKENYLPDWEAIEQAIGSRTRLLIINNPHNPSGKVWDEADLNALISLMRKYPDLLLLSDEVYEFIHFEKKHLSINLFPELYERTVITSSFGKTFHVTGWKLAYLLAAPKLMQEIQKVHQFNVFSVNSIAQFALAQYLPSSNVAELHHLYQEKRNLFASLLNDSKFRLLSSEGTYFQLADFSAISEMNDVRFCEYLTTEVGVAAIPVSVFRADRKDLKHIRFCFAKKNTTLITAAEKLCKI